MKGYIWVFLTQRQMRTWLHVPPCSNAWYQLLHMSIDCCLITVDPGPKTHRCVTGERETSDFPQRFPPGCAEKQAAQWQHIQGCKRQQPAAKEDKIQAPSRQIIKASAAQSYSTAKTPHPFKRAAWLCKRHQFIRQAFLWKSSVQIKFQELHSKQLFNQVIIINRD